MSGLPIGQIILGILGTGFATGLVQFLLTRPKIRAEAAQIATTTTTEIINNLRTENADLRSKQAESDKRQTDTEAKTDALEAAGDASAQTLREMKSALWDCWTWMQKADRVFQPGQRAQIGALPDVSKFFQVRGDGNG